MPSATGLPGPYAEPATPAAPVLSTASNTSPELSSSTEPAAIAVSGSLDEGSRSVLADAKIGAGAPLEMLNEGVSEHVTTAVDAAAGTAATTDVAAVAQAAETAATAGFSLSDTLLQPAMFLLNTVHDYSGLPWWMAIGAATFVVRTAILPLTVTTMRNSARMAALQDEIAVRREEVMEAMRAGDRTKQLRSRRP